VHLHPTNKSVLEYAQIIQSPALQAIVLQWNAVRGGNLLPSFGKLHLSEISIKRIWVYRYDADTRRFTGLLSGDQITKAFGRNFRGLPLEDAYSASDYLWVHQCLSRVVTEPAIYSSSGNLYRQAGRVIEGERLALPLATDGRRGDGVLGISDFRDPHLTGPLELLNENEAWLSLRDSRSIKLG
jgi:hypothetical protein